MKRLVIALAITIPLAPTVPLGLDSYLPVPEDNPLTPDRVALGRKLFRDSILSRDGTIACVSCHDPARAFTDGQPLAVGAHGRVGSRSAPSIINRAYGRSQFWDGRAATIEQQVVAPIGNPVELNLSLLEAVARIAASAQYRAQFARAFGRTPNDSDLARALAGYVRTILAGNSPYDRFVNGDTTALSTAERRGLQLFRGKAACTNCHFGPTLTDERFHNTGVAWHDSVWADSGRSGVTSRAEDRGAFKTPTLREVGRTAPYMHDGSLPSLRAVIDYYDRGANRAPGLDPDIHALGLTDTEKSALESFLKALTGEIQEGFPPT